MALGEQIVNKDVVSGKQGISLIILFIIGTSSIETSGLSAGKDFWLSIIISIFMALPILIIYTRLHYLFPGKDLLKGAYETFIFPFTQTVVFMMVFAKFDKKNSPVGIYIKGLLIGAMLVFIISITNILALGVNAISTFYFPIYATLSKVDIGNILQRVEIVSGTMFYPFKYSYLLLYG